VVPHITHDSCCGIRLLEHLKNPRIGIARIRIAARSSFSSKSPSDLARQLGEAFIVTMS